MGVSLFGAVLRPWWHGAGPGAAADLELPPREQALVLVFGAPPAVLNYMFAERYDQRSRQGGLDGADRQPRCGGFLPIALALVLDWGTRRSRYGSDTAETRAQRRELSIPEAVHPAAVAPVGRPCSRRQARRRNLRNSRARSRASILPRAVSS